MTQVNEGFGSTSESYGGPAADEDLAGGEPPKKVRSIQEQIHDLHVAVQGMASTADIQELRRVHLELFRALEEQRAAMVAIESAIRELRRALTG
jgi:UDP-N-acetyl-D-mannosaminuronate dehydrogenase